MIYFSDAAILFVRAVIVKLIVVMLPKLTVCVRSQKARMYSHFSGGKKKRLPGRMSNLSSSTSDDEQVPHHFT